MLLHGCHEFTIRPLAENFAAIARYLFLCHDYSPSVDVSLPRLRAAPFRAGHVAMAARHVNQYTSSSLDFYDNKFGIDVSGTMRVYMSGRLTIETVGTRLGPTDFPGQQGRAAFALLVGERGRPIARSALADAIWPQELPASWDSSLSAIASKLRALLTRLGPHEVATLTASGGCYELRLPACAWIDHEAAADGIHEAEAALQAGDPRRAYGPSAIAYQIARRPFLPGEEGGWFEQRRSKLASIAIRALECRAEVYMWNGEHSLAVEAARDAVAWQPFRESAYRLLMRAHAAAGNAAEALRVYERCRSLIAEELGAPPSPETQATHRALLRSL